MKFCQFILPSEERAIGLSLEGDKSIVHARPIFENMKEAGEKILQQIIKSHNANLKVVEEQVAVFESEYSALKTSIENTTDVLERFFKRKIFFQCRCETSSKHPRRRCKVQRTRLNTFFISEVQLGR